MFSFHVFCSASFILKTVSLATFISDVFIEKTQLEEKHGKDGKMLFFAAKKASPIASSFRALAGTSVADCLNRDEEVFDSHLDMVWL